jgi:hypothetical protein
LIGLIALAASSCDDKTKEVVADVIVLSRDKVGFPLEGGTTTVTVASPSGWTATCPDGWVTLDPNESEGVLTVSVKSNGTNGIRSASITVTSPNDEQQISVHQSYTQDAVYMSLTAPDKIKLDSEGETNIFSVTCNGSWEVVCDAPWLNIDMDKELNQVTISVEKSEEEATRSATMTVTGTLGNSTASREITVSQICHSENPYFNLLGYYGLYAENWYYDSKPLGVPGVGTFCTIEQNVYRESVYIKNLFMDDTVVEASFNKEDGTLSMNLVNWCLIQYFSDNTSRTIFLKIMNMSTGRFESNNLKATLGTGTDEDGQVKKALLLSGFDSTYKTLGLVVRLNPSGQVASYADLFYATGKMYLIDRKEGSRSTALTEAAAAITPSGKGISAFNN